MQNNVFVIFYKTYQPGGIKNGNLAVNKNEHCGQLNYISKVFGA